MGKSLADIGILAGTIAQARIQAASVPRTVTKETLPVDITSTLPPLDTIVRGTLLEGSLLGTVAGGTVAEGTVAAGTVAAGKLLSTTGTGNLAGTVHLASVVATVAAVTPQ